MVGVQELGGLGTYELVKVQMIVFDIQLIDSSAPNIHSIYYSGHIYVKYNFEIWLGKI